MKKIVIFSLLAIASISLSSYKTVIFGTDIIVDTDDILYDKDGDELPLKVYQLLDYDNYSDLSLREISPSKFAQISTVDPCPGKGTRCTYVTGTTMNNMTLHITQKSID